MTDTTEVGDLVKRLRTGNTNHIDADLWMAEAAALIEELEGKLAAAERRERQLLDTTATCRMLRRECNTAKAKLAAANDLLGRLEQMKDNADAAEAALPAVYRLALEDAEFACTNVIKNYDVTYDSGKKFAPMKTQKAAKGMVSIAREDIHALPTPTTAELMARIQTGEE